MKMALGFLVLLPSLALAQEPQKGFADERAVSLMERVEAKMRAAPTPEVIKGSNLREPLSGAATGWRLVKVQVQRPDKYRVEVLDLDDKAASSYGHALRVSDGKLRLTGRFSKIDPATKKPN